MGAIMFFRPQPQEMGWGTRTMRSQPWDAVGSASVAVCKVAHKLSAAVAGMAIGRPSGVSRRRARCRLAVGTLDRRRVFTEKAEAEKEKE